MYTQQISYLNVECMKCFTKMFTKSPGLQTSQIKNDLLL